MLPFLDKKKVANVIMQRKGKPSIEVTPEVEPVGGEMDPALKSAGEDLLAAIEAKSPLGIASALQAAFEICDSMPHEEGPHLEEEHE